MISVIEAQSLLHRHLPQVQGTTVALGLAQGYCLAQDIAADRDYPPFDRITHDGIALAHAAYAGGARSFRITSYAAAGRPRATLSDGTACIEVATGAPLPRGCDTVVPYESLDVREGVAAIRENAVVRPRDCLHAQGSDKAAGALLLARGQAIGIQEIAMLAANGTAQVPVLAKPAIGILSTGDELVDPGAEAKPHQIRRSNDLALKTSLNLNGFGEVETRWAPDDKGAIANLLAEWLEQGKWILITGGVSRGSYDYVPGVLESLRVKALFHHVAQRPGKPLWAGFSANGVPVFGLPGNPNSSLVCLTRYALPALRQVSGMGNPVTQRRLASALKPHPVLSLFTPVLLAKDLNVVQPTHAQNSGDFVALQGTAGFVEVPPADNTYAEGEKMAFYPWRMPS